VPPGFAAHTNTELALFGRSAAAPVINTVLPDAAPLQFTVKPAVRVMVCWPRFVHVNWNDPASAPPVPETVMLPG
jgi:hypothetical protein